MNDQTPSFDKLINTVTTISETFYPQDYNTKDYPPDAPKKAELNKRKQELAHLNKEYEKLVKYKHKRNGGNTQMKIVYITKEGISVCNAVLPKELHIKSIRKDGRGLFSRKELGKVLSLYKTKFDMFHKCDNNKSYIIPTLSKDKNRYVKSIKEEPENIVIKDGKEYKGWSWVKYFSLGTKLLDYKLVIPDSRLSSEIYDLQQKRLEFLNGGKQ